MRRVVKEPESPTTFMTDMVVVGERANSHWAFILPKWYENTGICIHNFVESNSEGPLSRLAGDG